MVDQMRGCCHERSSAAADRDRSYLSFGVSPMRAPSEGPSDKQVGAEKLPRSNDSHPSKSRQGFTQLVRTSKAVF